MANPLLLSVCAFLMLLVVFVGIAYRVYYKPGKFLKQLGTPVITDNRTDVLDVDSEPQASTIVTVLHPVSYTHLDVYKRQAQSLREGASQHPDLRRHRFR